MSEIVPVIMSGGAGTRLWPLSRAARPKQVHALVSDISMIEATVRRAQQGDEVAFHPPVIVLGGDQLDGARDLLGKDRDDISYVVEPMARNTAAVAAVSAEMVAQNHGDDALVLLMPADHHIKDEEAFRVTVSRAANLAAAGNIVTFGIRPTGPATGFGYICRGRAQGEGYKVEAFTEKPDLATARKFLSDGRYYWNAGIFLFKASTMRAELEKLQPEILSACRRALGDASREEIVSRLDADAFAACPSDSIDYAVMEKTDRAAVVPADFDWSDVGSWSSLWDVSEKDESANVMIGDTHLIDTRRSLVYSTGARVGVIGCDRIMVVATEDAVLVADMANDQDVKKLVETLRTEGRLDLL